MGRRRGASMFDWRPVVAAMGMVACALAARAGAQPAADARPAAKSAGGAVRTVSLFDAKSADAEAQHIAAGRAGRVYIAGTFDGELAGLSSRGHSDVFLAAYDRSGARRGLRRIGSEADERVGELVFGRDRSVYVMGTRTEDRHDESGRRTVKGFVARFDGSSGQRRWMHRIGASARVWTVAGTANGQAVYVATHEASDKQAEDHDDAAARGRRVMVTRYDRSGERTWRTPIATSAPRARDAPPSAGHAIEGLAAAQGGGVYIAGTTAGELDGKSAGGHRAMFLLELDASGNRQWTRLPALPGFGPQPMPGGGRLVGPGSVTIGVRGIVTGDSERIYALLQARKAMQRPHRRPNPPDFYVAAFDARGEPVWDKNAGRIVRLTDPTDLLVTSESILVGGERRCWPQGRPSPARDYGEPPPSRTYHLLVERDRDGQYVERWSLGHEVRDLASVSADALVLHPRRFVRGTSRTAPVDDTSRGGGFCGP